MTEAAQVQSPIDTPNKAEMLRIGSCVMQFLSVIGTSYSRFDVDRYRDKDHEFVIATHWGSFVIGHDPAEADVWYGGVCAPCPNDNPECEGHVIEFPVTRPLEGIVMSLLTGVLSHAMLHACRGHAAAGQVMH